MYIYHRYQQFMIVKLIWSEYVVEQIVGGLSVSFSWERRSANVDANKENKHGIYKDSPHDDWTTMMAHHTLGFVIDQNESTGQCLHET